MLEFKSWRMAWTKWYFVKFKGRMEIMHSWKAKALKIDKMAMVCYRILLLIFVNSLLWLKTHYQVGIQSVNTTRQNMPFSIHHFFRSFRRFIQSMPVSFEYSNELTHAQVNPSTELEMKHAGGKKPNDRTKDKSM